MQDKIEYKNKQKITHLKNKIAIKNEFTYYKRFNTAHACLLE